MGSIGVMDSLLNVPLLPGRHPADELFQRRQPNRPAMAAPGGVRAHTGEVLGGAGWNIVSLEPSTVRRQEDSTVDRDGVLARACPAPPTTLSA